ncbi:hypothetical protein BACUNI_01707 [Bacteroides uniformis ATCC 8492]|uniref:Uncharacterized protein n=1 Tax=Bacteroides uniformis (strain ATCC 8492 / DSM 6597 / CCUG 4942 / CIP 103695 / JCM 5828 / KCTC 5204 / NCTC 13054 / VPI 0061) TaxID=411479 RepID=A0ABC9ND88_BACUC|nr:hypothetical protein BACUNI_01707 [Bacteroides uniformis ATCC 8492]
MYNERSTICPATVRKCIKKNSCLEKPSPSNCFQFLDTL